jgi:hypothetical protein
VAWDTARALVTIAAAKDDDLYVWLSARVGELLGTDYRRALFDTRVRLSHGPWLDSWSLEVGIWRVRLEDLLDTDPLLIEDLRILSLHAGYRLSADR